MAKQLNQSEVEATLVAGGVGVIKTDTLYGLVARAADQSSVERVYELKGRRPDKPCIILIADTGSLVDFGVVLSDAQQTALLRYWPGPNSIVLPCGESVGEYLHRGTHSLAFRMPAAEQLQSLLRETGPLIAPSANPEGEPPATNIEEAEEYFGDLVDFYSDGGKNEGNASRLIRVNIDGEVEVLRA